MSIQTARRSVVEVAFAGVDITQSIRPYLLSMTYTDNEEDSADDLQIKLQDREGVWLTQWLEEAVDTAAAQPPSIAADTKTYMVTPKIGLNIRAGPGTGHKKLGAFAYGAAVEVSEIKNGWARITYSGKTAYVSAAYLKKAEQADVSNGVSGKPSGFQLQAVIVRENWNGDGKDLVLDCGQFELDSIDTSGPPATVTIKGTSLPYTSQIRQTKKSKAWEAYTLSGIAAEIARTNGMSCMYESANDPPYPRVEQFKTSDIHFLSKLCHDAGISLKVTNNILVLFDQAVYESKAAAFRIKRGDGAYINYKLNIGTANTQYTSCRVSYVGPSGKCIAAVAKVEGYKENAKNNQQLEVKARVSSFKEAKALAEKHLRLHNKYAKTASFTLPGNPALVAGITVMLEGWGTWDGKYIIAQAKHAVSDGYTTEIKLRRVLEGY